MGSQWWIITLTVALHAIDIAESPRSTVAALSGEIDLSAIGALEDALAQVLATPPAVLVLDLREVSFLDSSGLRLILRLDRSQREAGSQLTVVRGGRRVERVFELTGAAEHLDLVEGHADARPG